MIVPSLAKTRLDVTDSVAERRKMAGETSKAGVSHATGDSKVPMKAQEILPEIVERGVPNKLHDTSPKGPDVITPASIAEQRKLDGNFNKVGVSHATGDSKVPKKVQELVPGGLEKVLPKKLHDTSIKAGFS